MRGLSWSQVKLLETAPGELKLAVAGVTRDAPACGIDCPVRAAPVCCESCPRDCPEYRCEVRPCPAAGGPEADH